MDLSQNAHQEKAAVALSSILGAVVITGLKLGVGIWTGSLGIIAEAAHSGLDFLAAIITFIAVKFSAKPADREHRYGHGKVENFSALIETVLLMITCFWIINEAIDRLIHPAVHIEVNFWSFFVIIVSIAVDYSRSKALYRVARKYNSQALEADALHFSTDIWSSCVVLLGLMLTLVRVPIADSIAALIVAIIVIFISMSLGKRTIDDLLDRAPKGIDPEVEKAALSVPGVQQIEGLRLRNAGGRTFLDLVIHIRRTMPFELANNLVHNVEAAIHKVIPNADIVIHPEPVETPDESIADKIKLLMLRKGLIAHDIRAFRVNGELQIDLQVEFNHSLGLQDVHSVADEVEMRIKEQIPGVSTVSVHVEDSKEHVVDSIDVTVQSRKMNDRIHTMANACKGISSGEVLSVLQVGKKYHVSMRCQVERGISLEDAHNASTDLENRIMVRFPEIAEINIHVEPEPLRAGRKSTPGKKLKSTIAGNSGSRKLKKK
ncbi:MAG: cation-efflux pump [Ignavibacteriales bacterium]|nr:cation-efflux pump [Ignavibacteriales bacterium]